MQFRDATAVAARSPDSMETRRRVLEGRRLVLASNRGPVEYRIDDQGEFHARRGAGGVVSALASLGQYAPIHWICAALTRGDRQAARHDDLPRAPFLSPNVDVHFVVVPEETFERHYNVISNPLLWFVQHYLWNTAYGPEIDLNVREAWDEGYVVVNHAFADQIVRYVQRAPGERTPFTLLHDYQLYLVPGLVRERCPDAVLSHFIHIPWPGPAYWQLLPDDMRRAIVASLCQADVIGFQTDQFVRNFLDTCETLIEEAEVDRDRQTVAYQGHVARVRAYPISIDVGQLRRAARRRGVNDYLAKLQSIVRGRRVIVRVDRLDPSKNVLRGFQAYRVLLERRPDLHGEVVFLAFLVPSRTGIREYRRYRERVFALVDEINAQFGTDDWQPIHVFYENNQPQALAAMRLADVVLVNPVMDGMNLVAKEAVVLNERNAVLILSEGAGAHEQLGEFAITVGVADIDGTTMAIEDALVMPLAERAARLTELRRLVETYDLEWWIDVQLADLDAIVAARDGRAGRD